MKKFNITVNGKTYEVDVEEIGGVSRTSSSTKKPAAPAAAPKPAAPAAAPNQQLLQQHQKQCLQAAIQ